VERYCRSTLAEDAEGPNRYEVVLAAYTQFHAIYGLQTFALNRDLYSTLDQLHRTRVSVATEWLRQVFPGEFDSTPYLEPHTDTWFAALAIRNPKQAAMTRALIQQLGRKDVCSICGDEPARDHLWKGEAALGVDYFRLCSECLQIRRAMGDEFDPNSA
jgi:hypothetical protein